MIDTKKELRFYIMADMMMNSGCFKKSPFKLLKEFFVPDYTMDFLKSMRKTSYYSHKSGLLNKLMYVINKMRFKRLGMQLGWSIDCNAFGYGLSLPHYGTIVVGENKIGNYAVLQTCTCVSGNQKTIGNGLYMATGAKITAKVVLGDNVSLAANSVCTKSFEEGNVLLAGVPAVKKNASEAWYIRDGATYYERVKKIEALRKEMGLV